MATWAQRLEHLKAGPFDIDRLRRIAFVAQIIPSFATSLMMALGWHSRYYDERWLPAVRILFALWALLQPLLLVGALRPRPERFHLLFLVGGTALLAVAIAAVRGPWERAAQLHLIYQGVLAVVAFVLLPKRQFFAYAAFSALVQVGWAAATSPGLADFDELVTSAALPVIVAGGLLLLVSYLLDQLRERADASQAELARHNERLEREVAERAAVIERQNDQLLQGRKLEAAGTLAAGVAHDFNNLLTVILGYCHELKTDGEDPERVEQARAVIERSARRASELTQRLLGFARQGKVQDVPIDLQEAVEGVVALASRTMGERIRVTSEFAPLARYVKGDPVQLDQVLLNLALNARDAMADGGELAIATGTVDLAEAEARALALSSGRYLALTMRDTGEGIAPELHGRVFDPFFSTRWQGGGHGLGLAMAYGIVRNHGGAIDFKSQVGQGTTFRVILPTTEERPARARPASPARGDARGMMLILEDLDATQATAISLAALLRSGDDGARRDALERLRARSSRLEIVVLDRPAALGAGGRDAGGA